MTATRSARTCATVARLPKSPPNAAARYSIPSASGSMPCVHASSAASATSKNSAGSPHAMTRQPAASLASSCSPASNAGSGLSTGPSTTVVIFLLRSGESSESMANHDSEIMVWLCSCRGDAGIAGSALKDVKDRMRQLFAQERTAANAGLFLDGLLSEEQRKTGWMRSEAAGDPGPWRQQELLGRDRWNSDALRGLGRECVVGKLRGCDAVLVSV